MAWSVTPQSVEHSDDDKLDILARESYRPEGWEPPDYPEGLKMTLRRSDLEAIGLEGGEPGHTMKFSAMCEVTSTFKSEDQCRIEMKVCAIAGEDGKFHELGNDGKGGDYPQPVGYYGPSVCLTGPELEKIALADDAERGDCIHLIGEAKFESRSSTEWGGDCVTLQITHLTYEDESAESRGG